MDSIRLLFDKVWNAVTSPTPSWQVWSLFDSGAKALGAMFGSVLAAILGAGLAARYAYKKWLEEHLTDKWYAILELGMDTPEFMNEQKTVRYKQSFKDDDLVKYELFARTCVAFVDHMVNERVKDLTPPKGVYCGTGRLLAGRHRAWINDNLVDYNTTFQTWFKKLLKDHPLPLIADEQNEAPNPAAIENHTSP